MNDMKHFEILFHIFILPIVLGQPVDRSSQYTRESLQTQLKALVKNTRSMSRNLEELINKTKPHNASCVSTNVQHLDRVHRNLQHSEKFSIYLAHLKETHSFLVRDSENGELLPVEYRDHILGDLSDGKAIVNEIICGRDIRVKSKASDFFISLSNCDGVSDKVELRKAIWIVYTQLHKAARIVLTNLQGSFPC